MRRLRPIGYVLLACLVLSWPGTSKPQREKTHKKGQHKEDEFRVVEHYPLILIHARVTSRETGLPVSDLKYTDFLISENGVHQAIAIWEQARAPVSLLVLIDAYDPYNDASAFGDQIQALKSSLTGYLGTEDQVSIIVIGERRIVLQEFTSDKELISDAFDKIGQYRNAVDRPAQARFSEALEEAADRSISAHNPRARKAIILVSKTAQGSSDDVVLPEKVVRRVIESASTLCWTNPTYLAAERPDRVDLALDNVTITDLVGLTGGEILAGDWGVFIERLREAYRIGYVRSLVRQDPNGGFVRIKVQLAPNLKRDAAGLALVYPRVAAIRASR